MPEYPDITVYIEAIATRIEGEVLLGSQLNNPFLLRTVAPGLDEFTNLTVTEISRMGKRIIIGFGSAPEKLTTHWLVLHLMIAGRLHWVPKPKKPPGKNVLFFLEFAEGWLTLTEAGKKRRASLQLFNNAADLDAINPAGLEVLEADFSQFRESFTKSNHTLKRALTDPRILSGIGNAYSDEILHHAKLSPIKMTQKLNDEELNTLFVAIQKTLLQWTEQLRTDYANEFPEKVTAFRDDMAVHGRFGMPCPVCGTAVQRIRYATNETNYCPTCQTDGRVLADRSLSRLLKKDWPRTMEELEKRLPKSSA